MSLLLSRDKVKQEVGNEVGWLEIASLLCAKCILIKTTNEASIKPKNDKKMRKKERV